MPTDPKGIPLWSHAQYTNLEEEGERGGSLEWWFCLPKGVLGTMESCFPVDGWTPACPWEAGINSLFTSAHKNRFCFSHKTILISTLRFSPEHQRRRLSKGGCERQGKITLEQPAGRSCDPLEGRAHAGADVLAGPCGGTTLEGMHPEKRSMVDQFVRSWSLWEMPMLETLMEHWLTWICPCAGAWRVWRVLTLRRKYWQKQETAIHIPCPPAPWRKWGIKLVLLIREGWRHGV